jgi:predicted dehydrogenase
MDSPEKLKVGVVGLGMGSQHIEAYQRLPDWFEVAAVCDLNPPKAQEVAQKYQIPVFYTDFSELCRQNDLDIIDLCTPPSLHYSQIQAALAAGAHVVCEKPLVGSLKELDELKKAQAQANRVIMPIFQYRFGHGLQKLKFLQAQGLTGPAYLSTVETAWRRRADYYAVPWRGKWKTELGGTMASHAIHTLDMLTYILGPVKELFARTTTRVNPVEVEDCVSISMQMADGSLASLSATTGSRVQISRHRFCFSNMTAESNLRPYTNSGDPWSFTGDTDELTSRIEQVLAGFALLPESLTGQFYRFYQALTRGEPLPVSLEDGRAALELLTAIYYSSYTNQSVSLPLREDHPFYSGWVSHFS